MNGNKAETKENILEMVLRERKRLAEPGVVSIGLFGSFVRGDQNPESDIDLLVAFTPPHIPLTISWTCLLFSSASQATL